MKEVLLWWVHEYRLRESGERNCTWLEGIKQISAIKTDVFERISSFGDFKRLENISARFSLTLDIAWRTSVLVEILHKTDNVERSKVLSVLFNKTISRLIPSTPERNNINLLISSSAELSTDLFLIEVARTLLRVLSWHEDIGQSLVSSTDQDD